MKQAAVLLLTTFMSMFCLGQDASFDIHSDEKAISISDIEFSRSPADMISRIMRVTGLKTNFELREGKVRNIEASVSKRKRIIIYNPTFISDLYKTSNNKWAAITLFAHEIGHHLNGHTLSRSGSKPHLELEADEFAGFVLRKLGATLEESKQVMVYVAALTASKTHPARADRMLAIEKGWKQGY